jgi:hypothetical protein
MPEPRVRRKPVHLPDERKEPPQGDEEPWWEDDDLLEDPMDILQLPDETEMTTAEDDSESWDEHPLLEDPDEVWAERSAWEEKTEDLDPDLEEIDEADSLLAPEDVILDHDA